MNFTMRGLFAWTVQLSKYMNLEANREKKDMQPLPDTDLRP